MIQLNAKPTKHTSTKSYYEKLKDPRWQKKRLEIMERADFSCECCPNIGNTTLHIHHGYYEKNVEPWEYPNETLWCLCEGCHIEAQTAKEKIYRKIAEINSVYYGSFLVDAINTVKQKIKEEENRVKATGDGWLD